MVTEFFDKMSVDLNLIKLMNQFLVVQNYMNPFLVIGIKPFLLFPFLPGSG